MEELKAQLQRLQRNIDEYENTHGASCPTCGIVPDELADMVEIVVKDEIIKDRNKRNAEETESEPEEDYS